MIAKGGIFIRIAVGLIATVALVSTAYARSKPLVDPPVTTAPCELSQERMLQGIKAGLVCPGWVITDQQPGLLTAQVIVRGKHTLVVTIKYDTTSYDIDYKSSVNLNYRVTDDGTKMLHPNGSAWMENIRKCIAAQLGLMCSLEK
jgi:hypothetical protein